MTVRPFVPVPIEVAHAAVAAVVDMYASALAAAQAALDASQAELARARARVVELQDALARQKPPGGQ